MTTGRVLGSVFLLSIVAASAVTAHALASRQGAPAAGLILGQVVDASTNRGVGDSVVTLAAAQPPGSPPMPPTARDAASRKILTDGTGRFAFTGLPAGQYTLTTTRPGYTAGQFGKLVARGPGAPIVLSEGERLTDVRLLVWKHAVVTGRVIDEAGEPVIGASVKIFRRSTTAGRPGISEVATSTTDDRGIYRAASLEPGSYVVGVPSTSTSIPVPMMDEYARASGPARAEMQEALFSAAPTLSGPVGGNHLRIGDQLLQVDGRMVAPPAPGSDGRVSVYPSVFYPDAGHHGGGEAITLASGETRSGVDLQLRLSPAYRIEGRLEGPEGRIGIAALHLLPAASGLSGAAASTPLGTTVADASGGFRFLGIPPGQYVLRVIKLPAPETTPAQMTVVQTPGGTVSRGVGGGPGAPSPRRTWWATHPVAVIDRDLRDLVVPMQSGYRVSGSIAFEGAPPPMPAQRFYPLLESTDPWLLLQIPEIAVAADGTFMSPEVPPGRYRLTVPTPSGWFVKHIKSNGRDLPDLPVELSADLTNLVVTISNQGARVFGTVRADGARTDTAATVMLFPSDPRQWADFSAYSRLIKERRTDRSGAYTISELPAGEYFIVAVPQTAVDWTRPAFLESLSRIAMRLTLGDGESRSIDLRTTTVK